MRGLTMFVCIPLENGLANASQAEEAMEETLS